MGSQELPHCGSNMQSQRLRALHGGACSLRSRLAPPRRARHKPLSNGLPASIVGQLHEQRISVAFLATQSNQRGRKMNSHACKRLARKTKLHGVIRAARSIDYSSHRCRCRLHSASNQPWLSSLIADSTHACQYDAEKFDEDGASMIHAILLEACHHIRQRYERCSVTRRHEDLTGNGSDMS